MRWGPVSVALAALVGACGGAPVAPPRMDVVVDAPVSACTAQIQPGPSVLRRLTRDEYDATVRDLLGDDTHPAAAFPPDEDNLGFEVGAMVSPLLARLYLDAAEAIAARAVDERLTSILPCTPDVDPDACARTFVERFGRRAYRRHPSASEIERAMIVFRSGDDFVSGIRLVITAMLVSPFFLHRPELGEGSLTMDERATRLSYFLWGTMPDDELFAAADAGELDTPDRIEAQARRMLEDPRAHDRVQTFVRQWLEVSLDDVTKDEALVPEWRPELAQAMDLSLRRYVDRVVFSPDGTLAALLTTPDEGRPGLLAQPAFLTRHAGPAASSPVQRGRVIRERLLCQSLPPAPDGVPMVLPSPDAHASTRARYEVHTRDASCASCHTLMDPLGFALESYDAIGRFRTEEADAPIDARGVVTGTHEPDVEVNGADALARTLAASPDVSRCFTQQMWRFAFRRLAVETDACSIEEADAAMARTGGDVRALMIAIVRSDAFLHHMETP